MLGGFELITKIGQGGMGTVFKAKQLSLDRDVALKILPSKIAQSDPVFIERFIREARTSAKLNHPNIVQGIEVGKDDASGLYYFAMEYIDGATVKMLLKQGPLAERRAIEIGMGVTQALICAHRAGIVHRDIKPDNILLTSRGEPKLADLGLARHALDSGPDDSGGTDEVFGTRRNNAELTQAGAAVGTPSYMAPEQIKAEIDKIDARTDLYALGATLFHMVTGRMPYVAENSRAVMMQHLTAPVPDPRAVNSAVSEPLSKLIMRLLQKEQNKRVSSAEELAKELDRILNGGAPEKIRRGTGKQTPVRDSGRMLAIRDGSRPPTGDQSSYRTHTSGETAKGANKGTKSHVPVGSKKVLYIGASVAALACGGIVYAFFAGSSPAPASKPTPPPLPPSQTADAGKTDARPGPGGANATAPGEKWEPFEKALKALHEKPQDFANNLRLLDEAEKGAPQSIVLSVRHERSIAEHDRDVAFRNALDDLVRKARETVGGGKGDFVTALSLFKDGAIPDALLNDANRTEFNHKRGEFEVQAFNTFRSIADGIENELDKPTGPIPMPKLQGMLQRLEPLSKQYPVKAVQDRIAKLRREINEQIQITAASMGQQQESTFCRSIEATWSAARNGEYNDGLKALANVRAEPAMAERFGGKADIFKRDLETVRELVQKSSGVLNAKLASKEDILLHPTGGALLGKISAKDKDGSFVFDTRDAGEQTVDPDRLDPQDLLALSGSKADGAERKYLLAICSFWQGRSQRAYEALAQLKKESSDGGDAAVYVAFMNFRASELIAKITEYYHEVQSNSDLSPEQKKAKQADAQALMVRLKTDYGNTEAYLARKQKK